MSPKPCTLREEPRALIAVTGGEGIHQLGYLYAFVPCLLGALIMLAIALIVNNIPKAQRYPQFWW